jgi:predicted esterase
MTPSVLGVRVVSLLLLSAGSDALAQYAADDFATTDCGVQSSLFRSGLEAAEVDGARPSGGGGGSALGASGFDVFVTDTLRTHPVLVFVPADYDPHSAWPLVVLMHGAAGSAAAAPNAAAGVRSLWAGTAQAQGVLLLAPVASGSQGGWVPDVDTPALACAIEEIQRRYNIDTSRRSLWGFSAGGHYGHSLALGNSTRFAAYAVNAGVLHALACEPDGMIGDCELTLPLVSRRIPVGIRVGTGDSLRPYASGDFQRFDALGWSPGVDLTYSEFAGGHTIGAQDVTWAWAWLAPFRLDP